MKTVRTATVTGALLGALLLLSGALAQSEDLTAGRRLFNETAGGVGCAYCHGLDGRGDGTAGLDAPDIIGSQMPAIRASLAGGVPVMSFIKLNERELAAVAAYLQQLDEPEPDESQPDESSSDESSGQASAAPFFTVNVDITEEGFRPASISIPVGQTVQLVVRNRTQVEHHYRVVGLIPRNLLWLAEPEPERPEDVSLDDHEAHHNNTYVAWRGPSPAGIQPNGDEVHAWTHLYSPGGGKDVLLFQAANTGTFEVVCPLHPEFVGEVTVYQP